jgi:hypothetical protein
LRDERAAVEMKHSTAIVLALLAVVAQYPSHAAAADPKVIIIGAGMSGKSLAITHLH